MIEQKSPWQHSLVKGSILVATFVIVAEILVTFIPPAWAAVAIPITDKLVIELGDLPQWIIAVVAAGGLWKAWRAEQKAAASVAKIDAVAVQIDGLLTARDQAKVLEGEAKGKLVGVEIAVALAEGQAQGRDQERTSAAAASQGLGLVGNESSPLPVADDRTAVAAERSANAQERTATATEEKTK